jgi:hypothetical protein
MRQGYVYKKGPQGLGYYLDRPMHGSASGPTSEVRTGGGGSREEREGGAHGRGGRERDLSVVEFVAARGFAGEKARRHSKRAGLEEGPCRPLRA